MIHSLGHIFFRPLSAEKFHRKIEEKSQKSHVTLSQMQKILKIMESYAYYLNGADVQVLEQLEIKAKLIKHQQAEPLIKKISDWKNGLSKAIPLDQLPKDVLWKILENFNISDLFYLSCTSSKWNALINQPPFWSQFLRSQPCEITNRFIKTQPKKMTRKILDDFIDAHGRGLSEELSSIFLEKFARFLSVKQKLILSSNFASQATLIGHNHQFQVRLCRPRSLFSKDGISETVFLSNEHIQELEFIDQKFKDNWLTLIVGSDMTGKDLSHLSYLLPHLQSLILRGSFLLTDEDLPILAQFSNLKSLALIDCQSITERGFMSMMHLQWAQIQNLTLVNLNGLTDEGVLAVCEQLGNLENLTLKLCHKITSQGISSLLAHLVNLKRITIKKCFHIDYNEQIQEPKASRCFVTIDPDPHYCF